jgi:hypothetical protein
MEHYWKNVEKALHGSIKQLKRTLSEMDRNREKLEDILPRHINEQEDALPQTVKDERVEETVHGQAEEFQDDCDLDAVTESHEVVRNVYSHRFNHDVIFSF